MPHLLNSVPRRPGHGAFPGFAHSLAAETHPLSEHGTVLGGAVNPAFSRHDPPRCEVIKCARGGVKRLGRAPLASGRNWGGSGCPPRLSCSRRHGLGAAPRLPELSAKPWPRRPGHGPGARREAAFCTAVTCANFSMKTLIAAYSGVLRGERRAEAARSENKNGGSALSREGSGRWGECQVTLGALHSKDDFQEGTLASNAALYWTG